MARLDRGNSYDSDQPKYPEIPQDLLDYLDEWYSPDKLLNCNNWDEVNFAKGQHNVVGHIRWLKEQNDKNRLNNSVFQ